jgi:hypothetical protein
MPVAVRRRAMGRPAPPGRHSTKHRAAILLVDDDDFRSALNEEGPAPSVQVAINPKEQFDMNNFSKGLTRYSRWLFAAVLWAAGAGTAFGFTAPPNFIGTTFEGCRNDGTILLPIGGQFICPDSAYTSGNLGKGWNELDLVPFHLITSSGNSAGPSTTYNIYIAADYRQGTLGYDFISVPTVNPVSDASCAVSAGPQIVVTGITGGTDETAYRELTITQLQGKTCRFDWYQRLAIGAAQFSGSNLQAYIFDQADLGGGKRTIPIPVKEIAPQALKKDMTASQGSDHAWDVKKSATSNNLAFGDVCRADAPTSLPVTITVSWTKFAAIPGGPITVITHVYATNPAARVITTAATDRIYSGTTLLDTSPTATKDVPANTTNYLMLTHTYLAPAGTTDLNDIATASYTDNVTGVTVPGTTTATASATVQNTGPELNASASIADTETMSGAGLTFSVAAPSFGSFAPYVAGTQTTGPVNWGVTGETDSNSVTFTKTVYLDGKRVTTGELRDVASLAGIDGATATAGPLIASISSSATAKLTINKSYAGFTLATGEKLVFNYHVTGDLGFAGDTSITLTGGSTSGSTSLSGLTPDTYTVQEGDTVFYPAGCSDSSCAYVVPLLDPSGQQRTVDLTVKNGIATCTGAASYNNEPLKTAFPKAQVKKITDPTTATNNWTFTLKRPDGTTLDTQVAVANGPYVDFGPLLSEEGTYTVVETTQTGWDLTSATPNNGTVTTICSFTVNFPQDLVNKTFSCSFKNTQRGKAQVIKTEKGGTPTQAFTFELRQGASTTADGTTLQTLATSAGNGTLNFTTLLVPGSTYQICEWVMPGWSTNLAGDGQLFVPNSIIPPSLPNPTVNNMTVCANFTVTAGQTRTFNVDNAPPPGGRALTIGYWKNWASCKTSGGKQAPTLDKTLYGFLPNGIQVGNVLSIVPGHTSAKSFFGQNPASTADCAHAVSLLGKQNFGGKNMASDPLFNMAAQLVAAELNLAAGAYTCPAVVSAVASANTLLSNHNFVGSGYTTNLTSAESTLANSLATRLDNYNNDRASACQ